MGQSIPGIANWGLDITMVVAFIGIVVSNLKNHSDWACAITAGIGVFYTHDWPLETGLLFSSLLAIAVGIIIDYMNKGETK